MRDKPLTDTELRAYALEGARAHLARILEAFPALRNEHLNNGGPPTERKQGTRRRMSKAARALISARMTARWAEKRAREAKGAKGKR